jgi:hypothetical protein
MKHNLKAIDIYQDYRIGVSKRNAYHQAGHAAAIYIVNKQKQLPAVHFQIAIKPHDHDGQPLDRFTGIYSKYGVKVEGGRLIQHLPISFAAAIRGFSGIQKEQYRCAFEADIINMLAGSLAEAKYVALHDNEIFNSNLINLNALHFYGGSSAMEVINEYLECYLPNKEERDQKLRELFWESYRFVNERPNWDAITALAESIQDRPGDIIGCEEAISLLEFCLEA